MRVSEQIRQRLETDLAPTRLEIVDQSAQHAGHAGARPEGETHFLVVIEAGCFAGRSRVDRHRMVTDALRELLADRVHALSIRAMTPGGG